ncbi:MAG TPA: transglycosylase SLT domain-containing protein, partial [Chloroflexota bacterium]|nr:transglycosylase SLT domain-containing protein [Chloroflexota bacterium]
MEGWGVKDWSATSWGATNWSGMNQSQTDWGGLKSADWGAKQASWWNNMPTRYTYGQRMSAGGTPYEPQYGGMDYRPWSGYTQDLVDSDIQSWIEREHPELFEFNSGTINAGSGGGGNVGRMPNFSAGNFAKDPTVYDEIESAANQYGVPANFLQAIIAAESSGDWRFENARNGGLYYLDSRNKYMYPYVGVFEDTAKSRVPGVNFQALKGNRAGQIGLLAQVLRSQYEQITKTNPAYTWANVASFHYSGLPDPSAPGGMWYDESGNGSNASYMAKIVSWVDALDKYTTANGGAVGAGGTASGGGGMSSPNTSYWAPVNQWDRLVAASAAKYGVPANLIKSIMRFESEGIPTARSPQGATGLMQIMPGIHNGGNAQQLLDPAYNIDMGTR